MTQFVDARDKRTHVSTWLERVVLIAISKFNSPLSLAISPPNSLNLHEQVKAEIPGKCGISVNRSRGIYGFFTVFFVLQLVIGQRHFQNRGLSIGEHTMLFIPTNILAS